MPEEKLDQKVKTYRNLTEKALEKIEILAKEGTKEYGIAKDFLSMARNYFSDGKHFEEKGDLLTALASYSYAHAWIDAGVRAKILDGKNDDKLFTLP